PSCRRLQLAVLIDSGRAWLRDDVAGAPIGREVDGPAAFGAAHAEAEEAVEALLPRADRQGARPSDVPRERDLLRSCELRIDTPERAEVAHREERALRLGEHKTGESDVPVRVRVDHRRMTGDGQA